MSLSTCSLKGRDQARWNIFYTACKRQEFHLYLAQLRHTITGSCRDESVSAEHSEDDDESDEDWASRVGQYTSFHKMIEYDFSELKFSVIYDKNGDLIADELALRANLLVDRAHHSKKPPDQWEFTGCTGNEGAQATHVYRRACLILVPFQTRADFMMDYEFERQKSLEQWIQDLLAAASVESEESSARKEIAQICRIVMARNKDIKSRKPCAWQPYSTNRERLFPIATFNNLCEACIQLRWPQMFMRLAKSAGEPLSLDVLERLGSAVANDSLSDWQNV